MFGTVVASAKLALGQAILERVSSLAAMQQLPENNPAYAKALEALGDGAVRDFRIVEGVE